MKRTVFVGKKNFYVPFPYMLFQLRYGYGYRYLSLAFSPESIISLEQIVYFPWLPNVSSADWPVCLGKKVLGIKSAINRFWNSPFQDDEWVGDIIREKVVGSYRNWARLSLDTVCKRVSKRKYCVVRDWRSPTVTMDVRLFLDLDSDCDTKLEWE
jgi:hypothetical protein